jgi:hypothetical protein
MLRRYCSEKDRVTQMETRRPGAVSFRLNINPQPRSQEQPRQPFWNPKPQAPEKLQAPNINRSVADGLAHG